MTAIDLVLQEAYNVNWKQSTMLKTNTQFVLICMH